MKTFISILVNIVLAIVLISTDYFQITSIYTLTLIFIWAISLVILIPTVMLFTQARDKIIKEMTPKAVERTTPGYVGNICIMSISIILFLTDSPITGSLYLTVLAAKMWVIDPLQLQIKEYHE